MLKNFFIVTLRNLWRHRFFSLINIVGLAIGISASLVIFMIVSYEFSFDQFESDKDRIYRIVLDMNRDGFESHSAAVPAPLSKVVKEEVPGIEQAIPIFSFPGDTKADVHINRGEGKLITFKKQEGIVFTNLDYLHLLNYHWIAGDPASALLQPFQVVLTQSSASAYFPNTPAAEIIGNRLTYNDLEVTVTGIVQDLKQISDFRGKEFISVNSIETSALKEDLMFDVWNDWMSYSALFVKIAPHETPLQVSKELNVLYNKHKKKDSYFSKINLSLLPLADMHFDNRYQSFDSRIAHKPTLYGLIVIASFLLLLGCINYINLTTAQASKRAKEVGIRKSMGGKKKHLILQFLGETFFMTLLATLLSVLIVPFLLHAFTAFIPEGLTLSFLGDRKMILYLVLITISVSILAGLYPAFILSGYKPVQVLKNLQLLSFGQSRQTLIRKGLTVSQFIIAQFFVISTVLISKQIYFVLHADMGFEKEAILTFSTPRDTVDIHRIQIKQRLAAIPGVAMVSNGFAAPAMEGGALSNITYHNGKEEIKPNVHIRWGDEDYFELYQIRLIAGRQAVQSDSITEIVVNERFAKEIGFLESEKVLGKFITYNDKQVPIVGVMNDFHTQTMRAEIAPVMFQSRPGNTFHIKLQSEPSNWPKVVASIEKLYKEVYPEGDFKYDFIDDTIQKFYKKEQATASLLGWATGLAIFISCLGLLGLVTYTTNSRTKEVGIRKVLGATIMQIITLLSKDFIRLVLIAFAIAAPIAWWVVHEWLKDFAYKTEISWWVFLISAVAMLIIALAVLGIQTLKTAMANPTKSLRDE